MDARIVLALVFVAGCAYVVYSLVMLRSSLDSERASQAADSAAITQLSAALDTTRSQLQEHGVTPKAPPPTQIIQGVPGAQGVQGIPGPAGPSGPPGPSGSPGPAGSPGAVGPAGSAGSVGQAGAAGPAGPQGDQGPAGAAGAAGQPPAGWTYTDASGVTYDCERVAGFDPSSPRYSCAPVSGGGGGTPSPAPSQSAVTQAGQKPKPKAVIVSTGPR